MGKATPMVNSPPWPHFYLGEDGDDFGCGDGEKHSLVLNSPFTIPNQELELYDYQKKKKSSEILGKKVS